MDEQALLTKRLEQLLARECKVYSQYLKLMELEQAALRKNNLDQFQAYTTERAGLYEIMMESQEVRLELMRSQPHKPNMTLRSWILENFEPQYS
ncbi:MAG: hypothetical protein KDD62_16380, partial [Bdellovibrionales bacterium]|nr:hypothetical protein [Bdellovibrionales bacterium]